MFEIINVTKKYGDEFAIHNISMTIGKGLNFIIGSSGSGKTTLLKIISGMEQSFEGDALYCGQSIKTLTEQDKSYFYNNTFGFIWQDFNLLDDLTVLENVSLPQHLKKVQDKRTVIKILRELKISELANQKTGNLSGGQKQRVAIARELIKNPQVIIADEPTSALDEKSSKTIMDVLREISKSRTVIIVTHDTSLIDAKANVYELDKGELIKSPNEIPKVSNKPNVKQQHELSFSNACKISIENTKNKVGHFAITVISLLIAATLLLVTVSGAILDSSQAEFDKLFDTYGKSLLDIDVVGSFMSAGGLGDNENDEPSADVNQDIGGLYDKFLNDERVSHIVSTQAFDNIKITMDGSEYDIESSNTVPSVEELTAGVMPMGGKEVVVPQSFANRIGVSDNEMIGKTITFNATVYNWDSGKSVLSAVNTTAKIVGVVDSTVRYDDADGQVMKLSLDDSFFFSKSAVDEMRMQAGIKKGSVSFTIRAKTPSDMIAIKDELNANGIVPLGRFELVEDMVRLNNQTSQQSSSAIVVIGILSVVVTLAVSLMTAFNRRREYAIYKVSGYSAKHLTLVCTVEFLVASAISAVVFLCLSPVTSIATKALWNVNILSGKLLGTGVLLVVAMGMLSGVVTALVSTTTKASISLKAGDR